MSLARPFPRPVGPVALRAGLGGMLIAAVGAVVAGHFYVASRPADLASPLVFASHLYALILLGAMLWLAAALGLRLSRALAIGLEPDAEGLLVSLGLGLGGLAYLVLLAGFVGLLRPLPLASMLIVLTVGLRSEVRAVAAALPALGRGWLAERELFWREPGLRLALPLLEASIALLALRALAPPTGYDALMYHLSGPKELLQLGRLVPLPDLQQANMPFTVQLLYLLGLALGSDELPGLLHLSCAVLTAVATFAIGRRFFDSRVGWLAVTVFLSSTMVTVYAPFANVDFGWAFFEVLAVYAFLSWTRERQARWLVLAGIGCGLSLGSKYLGALTCAAIGLGVLIEMARSSRRDPLALAGCMGLFVGPAILVAGPWYLKNWLWLGSPVWPFLASDVPAGGSYFASHMNLGRTLADYLLLPLRAYVGHSVEYPLARPAPLFLLAPLYLIVRKHPIAGYLFGLAALHAVVWSQGIQTLRYLLPVFPALSLVTAYVLYRAMARQSSGAVLRRLASLAVVLSLLAQAGATFLTVVLEAPLPQLVGLESRQAYLSRSLPNHDAVRLLNERRNEVQRVLVIGDARTFYLDVPVRRDLGLDELRALAEAPDASTAHARLRAAGISHILISQGDLAWLTNFDPEGRIRRWWHAFEGTRDAYLIPEYSERFVAVYRVADTINERSQP